MEDSGKKYLKWGIWALLAGLGGVFVLPHIVTIAWNMVSLAAAALVLVGGYFLAPAFVEGMATLGWKLKEAIWKNAPVDKLWRDLYDFGKEIDSLEGNIAEVVTSEEMTKEELSKQSQYLDVADKLEWQSNIDFIAQARLDLIKDRDNLRADYRDMERIVRKEEANWKLGNAFNKTTNTLQKAGKIAAGTQGGRVSIDAIHERLAQGRARLAVIKSRKPLERRPEVIDTTVTEIPQAQQVQRAQLTNTPSPVVPPMKMPTASQPAANSKGFDVSKLDRI